MPLNKCHVLCVINCCCYYNHLRENIILNLLSYTNDYCHHQVYAYIQRKVMECIDYSSLSTSFEESGVAVAV